MEPRNRRNKRKPPRESAFRLFRLLRGSKIPSVPPAEAAPNTPLSLPQLLSRLIGVIGALAIVAAVFSPWFTVPGMSGEPVWCSVFRLLTAGVVVAAIVRFPQLRRAPHRAAHCATAFLCTLLLFPYFVTIWSPVYAGEASWLNAQHESLTGSSGDLYLSQETRADSWRQRVDVVNRPIPSEVIDLPDWTRLDLGRLIDLTDWFGASPWFAIFVRKGWVLALCGTAACLLALLRECGAGSRLAAVVMRRGLLGFAGIVTLALIPPALAVFQLRAAQAAAQRGEYAAAAQRLALAARCLPALREGGAFVAQQGLLDDALRIASPEAALHRARLLEARGFDEQAQSQHLAHLRAPGSGAVRRESLKSLLSFAADALNSAEVSTASALYAALLADDPQNLRANYALQLIAVRNADLARLPALQTQMETVYRGFNTSTKKAVLALGHENHALAEALDGNPDATWRALARARKP